MIDIQLLRKDIDAVAARLKTRKFELDVNAFNVLESERRQLQTQTEEMQARRNSLSKQIGILKGKKEDASAVMTEVSGIGDQLKANEVALAELQAKLSEFMLSIPNVPHESVPVPVLTKPTNSEFFDILSSYIKYYRAFPACRQEA